MDKFKELIHKIVDENDINVFFCVWDNFCSERKKIFETNICEQLLELNDPSIIRRCLSSLESSTDEDLNFSKIENHFEYSNSFLQTIDIFWEKCKKDNDNCMFTLPSLLYIYLNVKGKDVFFQKLKDVDDHEFAYRIYNVLSYKKQCLGKLDLNEIDIVFEKCKELFKLKMFGKLLDGCLEKLQKDKFKVIRYKNDGIVHFDDWAKLSEDGCKSYEEITSKLELLAEIEEIKEFRNNLCGGQELLVLGTKTSMDGKKYYTDSWYKPNGYDVSTKYGGFVSIDNVYPFDFNIEKSKCGLVNCTVSALIKARTLLNLYVG